MKGTPFRCDTDTIGSYMELDPESHLCRYQPTSYAGTLTVRCLLEDTHYTWTLCVPAEEDPAFMYDAIMGSDVERVGKMYMRANVTGHMTFNE